MNRFFNGNALLGAALVLFVFSVPQAVLGDSEVRLPRLFSDNMVLQQGTSVPVWGWGEEGGTTVTVKFRDQTVSARVAACRQMDGLPATDLTAGGPDTLTIIAGNTLDD